MKAHHQPWLQGKVIELPWEVGEAIMSHFGFNSLPNSLQDLAQPGFIEDNYGDMVLLEAEIIQAVADAMVKAENRVRAAGSAAALLRAQTQPPPDFF